MTDPRPGWQEALAPTPECIEIARLGEELDDAERAHVESCARCQAELALLREFQSDAASDEEAQAGRWIAERLHRRAGSLPAGPPAARRPASGRRTGRLAAGAPNAGRAFYAIAAAILIVIGLSVWMQMREPSLDPIAGSNVYRSARLDVIAPVGDLAQAPNELRWNPVPNASRYHVQVLEVDATVVWSGDTTQPHVALPPAVIAQFAPGKSLLWGVRALRGTETLASSDTQTVRVQVNP